MTGLSSTVRTRRNAHFTSPIPCGTCVPVKSDQYGDVALTVVQRMQCMCRQVVGAVETRWRSVWSPNALHRCQRQPDLDSDISAATAHIGNSRRVRCVTISPINTPAGHPDLALLDASAARRTDLVYDVAWAR